jgi:hypothetical protein
MRHKALRDLAHSVARESKALGWFFLFGLTLVFFLPAMMVVALLALPVAPVSLLVRGDWRWSSALFYGSCDRYQDWLEISAERSR